MNTTAAIMPGTTMSADGKEWESAIIRGLARVQKHIGHDMSHPKQFKCQICGKLQFGCGKYCPPPADCRDVGKRQAQTAWARKKHAQEMVLEGQIGERKRVLLDAYKDADPQRKRRMLECNPDLRRMIKGR